MTNQPKTRSSIVAITEAMVKGGLDILEQLTSEDTDISEATDAQLVIAIFTRMWQVKLKEEEAIRAGANPKSNIVQLKRKKLILPAGAH
jgi:hypothetical protein